MMSLPANFLLIITTNNFLIPGSSQPHFKFSNCKTVLSLQTRPTLHVCRDIDNVCVTVCACVHACVHACVRVCKNCVYMCACLCMLAEAHNCTSAVVTPKVITRITSCYDIIDMCR